MLRDYQSSAAHLNRGDDPVFFRRTRRAIDAVVKMLLTNLKPSASMTSRNGSGANGVSGFKGRHFDREIITLCVRWYLRHKLSFRDLVEMMAERG